MKKERTIFAILMASVGLLTCIDIVEDMSEGVEIGHVAIEIAVALSAFLALGYLWFRILEEKKHIARLEKEKQMLTDIADEYKQKSKAFVEGLSIYIDQTFNQWKLTNAERDIALFLLKGSSPKDIAEFRKSSEKTVRHQISSIYRKANINTREELTAYFLEDLLVPQ